MSTGNPKYEVGYKRPSKKHQWQKGQSGNPRGRPPKTKCLITDFIDKAFAQQISLTENGVRRKASVFEAILVRLWMKVMTGSKKALRVYLRYEDFCASKPITIRRVYLPDPTLYERLLNGEDVDFGEPNIHAEIDEEYRITDEMTEKEASEAYQRYLAKGHRNSEKALRARQRF